MTRKTKSKQPAALIEWLAAAFQMADQKIDQYIAHLIEQIEKVYQ